MGRLQKNIERSGSNERIEGRIKEEISPEHFTEKVVPPINDEDTDVPMGYNTQVDKMDIFTLNTGKRPREENFEVEEWVKNLALVEVYRRSFLLWDYDWIRQHFGDIIPPPLTNKSIVSEQKNESDSVTGEKTRQENVNVEEKNVILTEEEVLISSKGDTDVQSKAEDSGVFPFCKTEQSGSVDAAEIMMEASQKNAFEDFNFTGIKRKILKKCM